MNTNQNQTTNSIKNRFVEIIECIESVTERYDGADLDIEADLHVIKDTALSGYVAANGTSNKAASLFAHRAAGHDFETVSGLCDYGLLASDRALSILSTMSFMAEQCDTINGKLLVPLIAAVFSEIEDMQAAIEAIQQADGHPTKTKNPD